MLGELVEPDPGTNSGQRKNKFYIVHEKPIAWINQFKSKRCLSGESS